jgi:signal transduction histidine kinase
VDVRPQADAAPGAAAYDQLVDATPESSSPVRRGVLTPRVRTILFRVGVLVLLLLLGATLGHGVRSSQGWSFQFLLPVLVLSLAAVLLRRRPLLGLTLMLTATVVLSVYQGWDNNGYRGELWVVQLLALDLAVGYIAASRPRPVSAIAALTALAGQALGVPFLHFGQDLGTIWLIIVLAIVAAWMVGNSIRQRRLYAETLQTQAAAEAVTAERLRIAREVHDLIAHSIGIIAIQAGVGGRVIDTQPAEARKSLDVIEATSRETLAELRRTLGALRRAGPGAEPGAGPRSALPAPVDPTPGLADVDRLAASTLAAGVQVDVRWRGERRSLPADIDLSAFRIIQEAVTNVVRHADTRYCRVTVNYRTQMLAIDVTDSGKGCAAVGAGYGLVGMRERVSLLNGHLIAGPRPEGGFRVTAQLPVPVAAE